jgi:hypothetical protein
MTTAHDIDWPQLVAERLTSTHPDVLRELLSMFIHTLMGAKPTRCAARTTASAAPGAAISATGIADASSTPGQGRWI